MEKDRIKEGFVSFPKNNLQKEKNLFIMKGDEKENKEEKKCKLPFKQK